MPYGLCDELGDFWCLDNYVDDAILSGPSADPALGVERLRDPRVAVAWRTTAGPSSSVLTIEFAQPSPLQVFGVFGISDPNVGFTLQIASTVGGPGDIRAGPWTPDIDPDVGQALWINDRDLGQDPAPVAAEIRLIVTPDCDIGRVWAADFHWAPCVGHTYGSGQGIIDNSTISRSLRSGAVFADAAKVNRTHTPQYDAIPKEEWDGPVFSLAKTAGKFRQQLFVPNYRVYPPERHAICGYQQEVNPIVAQGFDRWSRTFPIVEAG